MRSCPDGAEPAPWVTVAAGRGWPGRAAGRGADVNPVRSSLRLRVQAAVERHLEQRLYQPQKLLEDLRGTDAQQFRTAMKYLLEDKKDRWVRPPGHAGSGACPRPVGVHYVEAN